MKLLRDLFWVCLGVSCSQPQDQNAAVSLSPDFLVGVGWGWVLSLAFFFFFFRKNGTRMQVFTYVCCFCSSVYGAMEVRSRLWIPRSWSHKYHKPQNMGNGIGVLILSLSNACSELQYIELLNYRERYCKYLLVAHAEPFLRFPFSPVRLLYHLPCH